MIDLGNDEYGLAFRWIGALTAVGVFAFLMLRPSPPPAPSNSTVFGCYVAAGAPPVRLDAAGMHIDESGLPTIPFHLEASKRGMDLAAEAPIQASPTPGGYRYSIGANGSGWYLPLSVAAKDSTRPNLNPGPYGRFEMLATDGRRLSYELADAAHCR